MGTARSSTLTGLTLAERTYYYHCVRAIDRAGNVSGWDSSNGFRVDSFAPLISSHLPVSGAVGVDIWASVSVRFSEAVDATSVTPDTFQVLVDGQPFPGTLNCVTDTCTFWPEDMFPHLASVAVVVTRGVKDVAGNALAAGTAWTFQIRDWAWSTPMAASTSNPNLVQVGIDGSGRVHLLWSESSTLWRRTYTPGVGWGSGRKIADVHVSSPALAVSESGHAVIMWADQDPVSTDYVMKATVYTPGGTWSAVTQVDRDSRAMRNPTLAIGSTGQAYAIWSTDIMVYAASWSPASGWGPARFMGSTSSESFPGYAVGAEPGGRGVAVWTKRGATAGTYTLVYSIHTPGTGWSGEQVGPSVAGGLTSSYPRMAFGADGTGMLAWTTRQPVSGGTRTHVYASTFTSVAGFGVPQRVQGDANANAFEGFTRVAVDGEGNAIVAWSQFASGASGQSNLWANRYEPGTGWGTAQLLESNIDGLDLGMDASGNATILYNHVEGSLARMWTRRYIVGSGWGGAVSPEPSTSEQAHPQVQLQVNGRGQAVVTWMGRYAGVFSGRVSRFD